jgi:tetratricopeptide (TPR) repeat protein
MKRKFLIFLFCISSLTTYACINGETKTLANGFLVYEDDEGIIPKGHNFYIYDIEELKHELDSLYRTTNKVEYLSDIGYVLIIEGKLNEALKLYLELEKKHPNRYSTASNIGTIYELLGENKKALEWINKAIRINPNSHNSSEWLHSKILEAKIKGSDFYNSNFLINVDFGLYNFPISILSESKLNNLENSIYYQLNERISFIKNQDSIIANLLFELGNIAMLKKQFFEADQIFKMAKEYGFSNNIIDIRLSYIEGFINSKNELSLNTNNFSATRIEKYNIEKTTLLILSIIAFLGLLFYIFKLKKANNKN